MTERAFPTDADRRALIANRASALRRIVEKLPMGNGEQKIRLVQELLDLAQNSDTLPLPRTTRVRSELNIQIVEHDPEIDAHARLRILDLIDILEADPWPPAWYAVASHALDAADRSEIDALADAYAAALRAKDEAAAMALYAVDARRLDVARLWFRRHAGAGPVRVERLGDAELHERFDGRTAVFGTPQRPPLRVVATRPGVPDLVVPVDLECVRSHAGWRLG